MFRPLTIPTHGPSPDPHQAEPVTDAKARASAGGDHGGRGNSDEAESWKEEEEGRSWKFNESLFTGATAN